MSDLELGPEERSVVAAARDAHRPSEVQRARVRRGLDAKLVAGAAAPLLAGSTALAMTSKIGAAIALVAAVGAGTTYVVTARSDRKDGPPPSLHKPALRVPPAESPVPAPSPPPASALPREDARPTSAPPRSLARRREASLPPPSDLAGELALLTQVSAASKRGDVVLANELIRAYDQRFPSGKLAEERAAAGILVLCAAGHVPSARAEARRFLERWPRSPLVARIRSSCAAEVQTP
jgi:hypothetical protein